MNEKCKEESSSDSNPVCNLKCHFYVNESKSKQRRRKNEQKDKKKRWANKDKKQKSHIISSFPGFSLAVCLVSRRFLFFRFFFLYVQKKWWKPLGDVSHWMRRDNELSCGLRDVGYKQSNLHIRNRV